MLGFVKAFPAVEPVFALAAAGNVLKANKEAAAEVAKTFLILFFRLTFFACILRL